MQYLVSNEQMKAIDSYTIEQIGIPAIVLMERAAIAVSNRLLRNLSKNDSILSICGTGNNGADGIATARILTQAGYPTDILIVGDEKRGTEQFRQQLHIARNLGLNVLNNAKICEYNSIIDAIFGIGLSKPIAGAFLEIVKEINNSSATVYSVDIPSGINGSDGMVHGVAVRADYTITFGYMKTGLVLYPGCEFAGEVTVADIGFPKEVFCKAKLNTFVYDKSDLNQLPIRKARSNKGDYGRVLIIAGSKNMSGACYLSAKAAYRSGAGLVKILTVEENRSILQTMLPEAILSTYDSDNVNSKLEIDRVIAEINWATSIVIGPGLSVTPSTDQLLSLVLKHANVPVVIDADGINLLANHKECIKENETGRQLLLPNNIILTPHLKEMSRLLDCPLLSIKDHLLQIAEETAKDNTFTLVLKDAKTIVCNGVDTYINTSGNNGMATGGSGDVLTGIIAAFLAQGLDCFHAAALGVYVHGLAGDYACRERGYYSLMAGDLLESLGMVLK